MRRLTVPAPVLALSLTVALALLIGLATLMPVAARIAGDVPGNDKLHHLVGFALLALPLAIVRPRWMPVVALVLAAYGGVIELIQPHVGRGRELADWWADLAGIALGTGVGVALNRMLPQKP